MRHLRSRKWRRQGLILLLVSGLSVFFIFSSLFAGGPQDSAKARESKNTQLLDKPTPIQHSPVSLKALERLQANSSKKWRVFWNEVTGLPGLDAGRTKKNYSGDASEVAAAFVADYKELFFGIDDEQLLAHHSLVIDHVADRRQYIAVKMQQYYMDAKALKDHVSLRVTQDGKINRVANSLENIQLDNVTPSFSKADAEEIIQQTFAPKIVEPGDGKMELVVYPSLPPQLAYHAYRKIAGWNWIIYIDAVNGEVLSSSRIGSE